jgi:hypothetical protein
VPHGATDTEERFVRDLLSQLTKHIVEVVAGLFLAVVGAIMTVLGAKPGEPVYLVYVGAIGTALGGILLSWTIGRTVSRRDAMEEVRTQLGLVSKNLGQVAGQISRVVDQCSDHSLDPETGFALVGQSATLVGAQVNAIQGMLGDPFDAGDLLTTLSEMENLAGQLDRRDRRGPDVGHVKTRLQEMREEISGARSNTLRVTETVECPMCRFAQQAQLGAYPGDTSASTCRKCGSRFNSHRRSDGSVFTRIAGAAGAATSVVTPSIEPKTHMSASCPKCEALVKISVVGRAAPTKGAVCLECGTSIIIDLTSGAITSNGQFEKLPGTPVARYGSGGTGARPIILCEQCNSQIRAIIRKDSTQYAIDNSCRRLYEVSNEEWDLWRSRNDPVESAPNMAFGSPPTSTPIPSNSH